MEPERRINPDGDSDANGTVTAFPRNRVYRTPPASETIPPFPTDVLPPVALRFVVEYATAIGCPPEYVAVPLLVFAGSVVGRSRSLQLKRGWQEQPILYAAIVGESGDKKSPALAAVQQIIATLQQEADANTFAEPKDHLYTTNVTVEALLALARDSQGLTAVHDELVGWINACDMYRSGKGNDRQTYLSLWSGAGVKVDRKEETLSVSCPDPRVSILGSIQPGRLKDIKAAADEDDGLLARLLFAWPSPVPDVWTDEDVTEATTDGLRDLFRQLRKDTVPVVVQFDAGSKQRLVEWYNDNTQRTSTLTGFRAATAKKLPSQLARLALVLHCLTHPGDQTATSLSLETLEGAIRLVEYFRCHAARVLTHLPEARQQSHAERIFAYLGQSPGWVNQNAIRDDVFGRNVVAGEVTEALMRLERDGLVEQQVNTATGGRPSHQWRVAGQEKEAL